MTRANARTVLGSVLVTLLVVGFGGPAALGHPLCSNAHETGSLMVGFGGPAGRISTTWPRRRPNGTAGSAC